MENEITELDILRESLRDVLQSEWSADAVQRHCASQDMLNEPLWQVAVGLGWLALPIAEVHGGLAMSLNALAILYEELGRSLAPIPVLSTLLAADAIARGGSNEQCAAWLPRIAAGELRGALSLRADELSARRDGDAIILFGQVRGVPDAAVADLIVLAVSLDGESQRIVLLPKQDGCRVTPVRVSDRTRTLGLIDVEGVRVEADRLLSPLDEDALARHAAIGIACDAAAAADEMLAVTIEYLKVRQQFGRVIGSFQSLKHRVADHKAGLVVARAAIDEAVRTDIEMEDALAKAYAAKAHATFSATSVTHDCIQLHGGIGYTAEHIAHRYHKRVLLDEAIYGSVAEMLDGTMKELLK